MARSIRVRAVVGVNGLRPGQIAEVESTRLMKALLARGLVEQVVTQAEVDSTSAAVLTIEAEPEVEPAPEG